mmetsp:Transcript_17791/g.34465  ORF Transcript_17791/g.34465 Transcript_17791/m.34465 type:complete len:109 (-) Transcript_17791:175-501(-)
MGVAALAPKGYKVFCVNVTLYVKPDRRDEFLQVIANNKLGTDTKEPLALEYTWGVSTKDPNTFHFQEKYKGEEGFKAHQAAPHFAKWEEFVKTDPFTKEPEVQLFEAS